ncbi:hypothetical protein OHB56_40825 [Streptomyces sp. NBC_01635]|uniref:hypothetical protein n=1 Tax=Streptomyces sp. NBC_01635 TaxID=2975904 RepID=UPI0038707A4A|nr:hypothetical protein OHB56_00085 [Streptomyces sp. NBC_01635]WTD79574.1 hypothetical protein OHB56_40825 [Streptomyces sp. NBC_01635]
MTGCWIESEQRVSLYGTVGGVVSAIGGLCSITVYLSSNGDRIRAARSRGQSKLRHSWEALLVAAALICMGCLAVRGLVDKTDWHRCNRNG